MTPEVRRLAKLWYGPLPLAEVARQLGQSETRVRVDAVIVHKLGYRTAEFRDDAIRRGLGRECRRKELARG